MKHAAPFHRYNSVHKGQDLWSSLTREKFKDKTLQVSCFCELNDYSLSLGHNFKQSLFSLEHQRGA